MLFVHINIQYEGRQRFESQSQREQILQEYEAAYATYDECLVDIMPSQFEQCQDALNSNEIGALCSVCEVPEQCEPRRLLALASSLPIAVPMPPDSIRDKLPPSEVAPPIIKRVGHNKSDAARSISTDVCVLTGFGGKFAGGAESVRLKVDQNYWRLITQSNKNEWYERMFAEAICAAKDNFFDTGSSAWTPEQNFSLSTSNGSQSVATTSGKFITALSGIEGRMNGGGEWAFVEHESYPNNSLLKLASQVGYLEAYATSFGLTAPYNNVPQQAGQVAEYSVDSNGARAIRMAPVDSGLCFLNRVSGAFDGGAETVRIQEDEDAWVLSVTAACIDEDDGICRERKHVSARARCYNFNQLEQAN